MKTDQARSAVERYGSIRKAATALGVSRHAISNALKFDGNKHSLVLDPIRKAQFAVKEIVNQFLPNVYVSDSDMKRASRINENALWQLVRKSFGDYVVEVGSLSSSKIFWGARNSVASLILRGKARRPVWARK